MVNVRQCILSGSFHHTPTFISALFDFLTRQPLRELNVNLWTEVSAVTILRFLTIAPVVSFRQVVINQDLFALSDHSQHTPKVEDLFIDRSAPQIHELLAQPQFKSFTGTLRHLFVSSLSGVELLVATAPMLEHLHLGVGTSFYPPLERVLSSPTSSFHSRLCLAAAPQTQCCCPTSILRLRLIPDARVFDGGSIWKITGTKLCAQKSSPGSPRLRRLACRKRTGRGALFLRRMCMVESNGDGRRGSFRGR
ncbi:hypothetical protein B0H14DRAFT_2863508, partial [Mycena olivaceomarginata]